MTPHFIETTPSTMEDVILDILARHKDGSLTDPRGRSALNAFITSLAPDDFFSESALNDFQVYLDITLQLSKRSRLAADPVIAERIHVITALAAGDEAALASLRAAA